MCLVVSSGIFCVSWWELGFRVMFLGCRAVAFLREDDFCTLCLGKVLGRLTCGI